MKLENVGEIIAYRKFMLVKSPLPPVPIGVLLGKPKQFPDHTDYFCPYQIKGAGHDKVMAIGGVDAFQAIQLALSTTGVELEVINRDCGGKLIWDAGKAGDFGFPPPDRVKR